MGKQEQKRKNKGQLTKGGKDHEKTFTKRSGNFAVIELAHACVVTLSKVKADLFPGLAHGYVKRNGGMSRDQGWRERD
jgi:hypothetical protein